MGGGEGRKGWRERGREGEVFAGALATHTGARWETKTTKGRGQIG